MDSFLLDESGSMPDIRYIEKVFDFGERRREFSPREKHVMDKLIEGFKEATTVREYDVTVIYWHNMPSITTERTVTVDARNEIEAEEKVKKMFPNITSISVCLSKG
jgi:hypothetical protein